MWADNEAVDLLNVQHLVGAVIRVVTDDRLDPVANLQSRGLRTDRSLLVILDGAKALHKAVRAVLGEAALLQRCQVHKLRNILDYRVRGASASIWA